MRDDFPEDVKHALAGRAAQICSNPHCQATTSGPQDDSSKFLNIGVAAHITAASPGGARYDDSLTPEQRKSTANGIWLCQNCAKLVDNDESHFDIQLLKSWKYIREHDARLGIGQIATKTMRDIVTLQEKSMEQWIELHNWRSQLVKLPLDKNPNPFLLVKVDIANKTNFPVTLKRAEIDFTNTGDRARRTYFAGDDTFLTPSAPHVVVVASVVTEQQVSQFPLGGIGMQIAGRFAHIGVLKKLVTQEVSGLLVCRESETEFMPEIHMNPKSEEQKSEHDSEQNMGAR